MARVRDLWVSSRTRERTARHGIGRRWLAEWTADGKVCTKAFDRKVDAERHLATTVAAVLAGAYVDPGAGRLTVAAYAQRWLAGQVHLRASSADAYRTHLRVHILPALGSTPLGGLSRSGVQSFVSALTGHGLSPAYVRGVYVTLASLLRAAARDRLIPASPCDHINLPAQAEGRAQPFTAEQIFQLADALPPRYAVLPELGAGTGLRPGELYGLEVDEHRGLDFLRRRIRVRQQLVHRPGEAPCLAPVKTRSSERDVPVGDPTLDALAEHLARFPAAPVEVEDRTGRRPVRRAARLVLTAEDGGPMHPKAFFRSEWTSAVRALGDDVPARATPHALRHTCVSLLIAAGRHPRAIQELLGHRSMSTTMDIYGHLFPDDDEQTRAALASALRRTEPQRNEAPGSGR